MSTQPSNYMFNHTSLRVKDPQRSVQFYTQVLGMKLVYKKDFESDQFTLYFLAYTNEELPESPEELSAWVFSRPGVLELTHNWGTEKDDSFKGYHSGNQEPRGYGHIALTVDNVEEACKRLDTLNVNYVKRPEDGKMRDIAFITDPDGYWIELLPHRLIL
ncbi:glyoxalase I [Basidiobolus meristosporus CBS 931.73]|uniref:Lactoylglutathione lyase n=1 Tax=Basidiobolus meristosporus CBS 931.73 TaxID=1314790 RepID=A0A1Y1WZP0_9FUNG|nr:glyoxalase I [Basidiobolus meristosporus CBS 931.73]|eukprot:ORX78564.1 glyoxalase I [Basidiobolus meristosporus CBS 931.73]